MIEVKEFSINIEPMYIGKKKDNRKEWVVSLKKYNVEKDTIDLYQATIPPKSRLGQEVSKLLALKVIK
jgi:hypothetical protein